MTPSLTYIYAAPDLSAVTAYMRDADGASWSLPIDVSAFAAEQQSALAGVMSGLAEQIPAGETFDAPTAWEDSYSACVHTIDGSTPPRNRVREVVVSEASRQFLRAMVGMMEGL